MNNNNNEKRYFHLKKSIGLDSKTSIPEVTFCAACNEVHEINRITYTGISRVAGIKNEQINTSDRYISMELEAYYCTKTKMLFETSEQFAKNCRSFKSEADKLKEANNESTIIEGTATEIDE